MADELVAGAELDAEFAAGGGFEEGVEVGGSVGAVDETGGAEDAVGEAGLDDGLFAPLFGVEDAEGVEETEGGLVLAIDAAGGDEDEALEIAGGGGDEVGHADGIDLFGAVADEGLAGGGVEEDAAPVEELGDAFAVADQVPAGGGEGGGAGAAEEVGDVCGGGAEGFGLANVAEGDLGSRTEHGVGFGFVAHQEADRLTLAEELGCGELADAAGSPGDEDFGRLDGHGA